MSGGRFLISLREFKSSNKILNMMSLLKADTHCWNKLTRDVFPERDEFVKKLKSIENEFEENMLSPESKEVALHIAGYITKQLLKKSECNTCITILKSNKLSSIISIS